MSAQRVRSMSGRCASSLLDLDPLKPSSVPPQMIPDRANQVPWSNIPNVSNQRLPVQTHSHPRRVCFDQEDRIEDPQDVRRSYRIRSPIDP